MCCQLTCPHYSSSHRTLATVVTSQCSLVVTLLSSNSSRATEHKNNKKTLKHSYRPKKLLKTTQIYMYHFNSVPKQMNKPSIINYSIIELTQWLELVLMCFQVGTKLPLLLNLHNICRRIITTVYKIPTSYFAKHTMYTNTK